MSGPASGSGGGGDQLSKALDLLQRLPPANMRNNLAYVLQIAPDIAADLLDTVDQPLDVQICPQSGAEYIQCEFNRDEDSYRSPWSNQYDPPLPDGRTPPEHLRELELAANDVFRAYREQYYGGGVSSVYAFESEGEFAVAVLLKKTAAGGRSVETGVWDAIHVVDVAAAENGAFTYKIVSTIILSVVTESGAIDLSGSLTKTDTKTLKLAAVDKSRAHLVNIGNVVQDLENSMFNQLDRIYFGKTKDVACSLRKRDLAPALAMAPMMSELSDRLKSRAKPVDADDY